MQRNGSMSEGKSDIYFECVRCGQKVSLNDLLALPEIKCICGFRVLRKVRPQSIKQVKSA
jgi:DNA-directed RNA polymerase subunit P